MAVTAGALCLVAGVSSAAAQSCPLTGSAAAGFDCGEHYTPPLALNRVAVAGPELPSGTGSTTVLGGVGHAAATSFLGHHQSTAPAYTPQSSLKQPLFHIAPKQSPPAGPAG